MAIDAWRRIAARGIGTGLMAAVAWAAPAPAQDSTAWLAGRMLPPPVTTVTLAEAIRRAEQVQPGMVQAEVNAHNAQAQKRAAWGAFLPNVSGSAGGNNFFSEGTARIDPTTGQVIPGNSSATSVNFGLAATVDIFTGLRRKYDLASANAQIAASDAGLINTRFQQRLQTTNSFLDALAAAQLVKVREASVRRAEEQLKVAIARLRAGTATRSDSLRSMVQLGTARLDLVNAQSTLAAAEAALGRLIGVSGRVAATDDSAFYAVTDSIDVAALEVEAAAQAPSVQSAEAAARAARAAVASARAAYLPSLSLSGQYTYNGSSRADYRLFNQRQLNLSMSWNIFNRFARERQITLQSGAADVADATAQDARRQVVAQLIAQAAQLQAARVRIQITNTSLAAAQEDLRVQNERYRLGVATILDVLTSQVNLNQAEIDVLVARYDYLRAKAQIEALIGRSL
ncbi:MAG: TolC family protein [Gemmatimonadota bacterium]